jgi:integrase
MENALRYIWEDGHYELVEALEPQGQGQGGRIDLPTLYHAWRRDELGKLGRKIHDPPLEEAVRDYAETLDYDSHVYGARHILRMTIATDGPRIGPAEPRVSWLYEPAHIGRLQRHMIQKDGYKPNTVAGNLYGFVSKFLRHRLGEADAQQILAAVERPTIDDRRDVWLTAADVRRVISASEWEVRMFLLLSASTGVDKSPILRIHARDVDFSKWSLYVRDTKETARKRTIQLPPVAVFALKLLLEGKSAGETAFELTRGQLDYRWRRAREAAGLTPEGGFEDGVRLKDLRHTFAVHYMKGGGSIAGLQGRLGHARGRQSMRYARHEVEETTDMEQAAQSMGLEMPEWLKDELPQRDSKTSEGGTIPAWWFDPDAPPRLEGKELDVPAREGDSSKGGEHGGGRKGLNSDDYREAVQEGGNMAAAGRILGVNEKTVREQCKRHDIRVPSIGGVPQ